ncbi:5-methylcytosine restriction system specificity protein McrC [Mesonia mobilis]
MLQFSEHEGFKEIAPVTHEFLNAIEGKSFFKTFKKTHRNREQLERCYEINCIDQELGEYAIKTNYYIGVDWVIQNKLPIQISPKIDKDTDKQTDYLKMLLHCMKHPEVTQEIKELVEVKWEEPKIEIEQHQDFLTPFLIIEFLGILRRIVKKGLKKSYYKVEHNLQSRVKGKVLVSKTIKHNLAQNKNLHTYCQFEEFGVNTPENKLLNKAFELSKAYLPTFNKLTEAKGLKDLYNYINPAFNQVATQVSLKEMPQGKSRSLFKEYDEALTLASYIIKRYGYSIKSQTKEKVETPPFWIDMSKLFELYTLSLLKEHFGTAVFFQFKNRGSELDYLLNTETYKMVIDAKYKPSYLNGRNNRDMRQVSGYARLKKVYDVLYNDKEYNKLIDCLIIYPDQKTGLKKITGNDLKQNLIPDYMNIYKLGVVLPTV